MSKFDKDVFYGDYTCFCVSKERYSKEEAIEIAKVELESVKKPYSISMYEAFVKHRAGVNEDHEPCVGWWLEHTDRGRNCPVWVFHKTFNNDIFQDEKEIVYCTQ